LEHLRALEPSKTQTVDSIRQSYSSEKVIGVKAVKAAAWHPPWPTRLGLVKDPAMTPEEAADAARPRVADDI
jgi:hypothetical protein